MDNIQDISINKLELNKGQIEGLPKNPRFIRDDRYQALVKSIEDAPEMLRLRELLVVEHGKKFVVIGGNMRLRACKDLGYKTVPCKVLPADTPTSKLREYAIKDNNGFGEDDWDILANEWDAAELQEWGMELPTEWGVDDEQLSEDEIERKAREFQERMAAGDIDENDEEYLEFLEKFKPKKTTDDCYTPTVVYEAVANWVSKTYRIDRKHFERPFYPGGDYQNAEYPSGCVVVDNPPFSILAEILNFYNKKGIKFFLFAPTLTLFSSSSCALPVGVSITYENGASVNTSFLTNLEPRNIRLRSAPILYAAVKAANDENLKEMRKELPKYSYPDYIVTSTRVAQYSHYGIDFVVPVDESQSINQLDQQKASGKGIYGKGYLVSERLKAEKERAERERVERERVERERVERERVERERVERWELSPREMEIVKSLGGGS